MNEAMNERTESEVLERVAAMVRDVVGEEWAGDVVITKDTSFSRDLELESIEFVALAEKLKMEFGKGVDFAGWLASKELKQILELRVGELVEFIVRCLSKSQTA